MWLELLDLLPCVIATDRRIRVLTCMGLAGNGISNGIAMPGMCQKPVRGRGEWEGGVPLVPLYT